MSYQTLSIGGGEPVRCPGCGKTRTVTAGIYLCARCGAEFVVEREAQ